MKMVKLSENWLAQKIANIDKTGGDIDTISKRIGFYSDLDIHLSKKRNGFRMKAIGVKRLVQ